MRAQRMLELSPLVTAASAPASSMPASARARRSKPRPTTVRPAKAASRRRSELAFLSITATVWPASSRAPARSLPIASERARIRHVPNGGWHAGPSTGRDVRARVLRTLKQLLVGRPLATAEQEHQRLTKKIALAIFSSDAISSTAYATEEILFVTAIGASSLHKGLSVLVPIALAVAILLAIVVTSRSEERRVGKEG